MKVIAIVLVIVAIVMLVWVLAAMVQRALARRRAKRQPWELEERTHDGFRVGLYGIRGREIMQLTEPVRFDHEDFEQEIELARAEAEQKLIALNNRR